MTTTDTTDFIITDNGTLWGFRPWSEAAQEWFDEHVESEDWQWMGPTCWVDHRPAHDLAAAIVEAGFEVRVA